MSNRLYVPAQKIKIKITKNSLRLHTVVFVIKRKKGIKMKDWKEKKKEKKKKDTFSLLTVRA